jgi:glycosyltransferase involved in cell wall biosynthesis
MRVAILSDLAPDARPVGGVQRATAALAPDLERRGIDVTIVAPHHGAGEVQEDDSYGFRVVRVPMNERYQVLRDYRPWVAASHAALERLAPDIVQGQGLLHNGASAARWESCPSVVTAHGDPLADARWGYPAPLGTALQPLLRAVVGRTVRRADSVVNVNPDWRVNCPTEPRRHVFIPNPIEPVFFRQQDAPWRPRIIYLGGARHIKGPDLMAAAWQIVAEELPDATLDMFGFGDADVERFGLPDVGDLPGVTVHGPVSKDEVARVMADGGVVAVPSRYEVSPVVVPEAWAVGLPVVVTNVGGVESLVGDAAITIETRADAFAEGVLRALRGGPGVDAMVESGARRAQEFQPAVVAEAYASEYEALLSGSPLGGSVR